MFLYEGDCLKNVTVIRGVRYVTVSHYSGDKEVCDKLEICSPMPFVHAICTRLRMLLRQMWI